MNDSEKHFEHAVALSRDALKALLLVNGGAATALIALMDKTTNSNNYTCAILLFGAGTITAVITSCFGYFSQLYYANHRMKTEQREDASHLYVLHTRWQNAAIGMVILTLAFMSTGMVAAAFIAAHK